ncbi:MAG: hypothetical protein ABSD31_02635 [Candidatus Binataceae bacterium]|jgi:hypothetical protein
MSYNESDEMQDEFIDEISRELYPEHRDQAIAEFTKECLQRFYLANRGILLGPLRLFREAQKLTDEHHAAALVFAFASIETLLKSALLKGAVTGLVHNQSLAGPLADFLFGRLTGLERVKKLLFPVVKQHAGIDLATFKRDGSSNSIWDEILAIQQARNSVLHRGDFSCLGQSLPIAILVAQFTTDVLFPAVLAYVGLHLHEELICDIRGIELCADKPLPSLPLQPPTPSATLSEFREYLRLQESGVSFFFDWDRSKLELDGDKLTLYCTSSFLCGEGVKQRLERAAFQLYRKRIAIEFRCQH